MYGILENEKNLQLFNLIPAVSQLDTGIKFKSYNQVIHDCPNT